ncbi:MAG: ImmA/IrrE family metallo-endopeptidase [Patescibacteria group bacterium]|nr:ImmA/IrrE family metallo-endopeptidase [Patescibacteria group bacterium]
MTEICRIKNINIDQLAAIANKLLEGCKIDRIPVDIENIVEVILKIKVCPIPDIKMNFDVDSYFATDGEESRIFIDKHIYDHPKNNRCRFSYAHELSHYLLHKKFYIEENITDFEKYLDFQKTLTLTEIKRLEFQAYTLAGYLLLPRQIFTTTLRNLIKEKGSIGKLTTSDIQIIISDLSNKFNVSELVILKQIKKEFPKFYDLIYNLSSI